MAKQHPAVRDFPIDGIQEPLDADATVPNVLTSENETPLFRIRAPKRESAERMCGHPADVCREPSTNSSGRSNPSEGGSGSGAR